MTIIADIDALCLESGKMGPLKQYLADSNNASILASFL